MLVFLLGAGLTLALVLLVSVHRRLANLPHSLWNFAQKERSAAEVKTVEAMKEAVATKAGAAVIAIRQYEEQIGTVFRAQVAEAETRARVAERRAADTTVALQAATALVRELREVLDAAEAGRPPVRLVSPAALTEPLGDETPDANEAVTAPVRGLPKATTDDEELGDDEKTRVGKRLSVPPPIGDESRSGDGGGAG